MNFECSRLLYVATPAVFACCSDRYMLDSNDREQIAAIAKTEIFGLCSTFFLVACRYKHAKDSYGFTHLDTHEDGFVVSFPALLKEDNRSVRLARLLCFGALILL